MTTPLLLPGGGMSASQRREHQLRSVNQHLMAVVAVLVAQQGGTAIVPAESLAKSWKLTWELDRETGAMFYTAGLAEEAKAEEPEKEPT